jgi:DNA-binding winged helix-turn-helix (wHTH) protein
MTESIVAGVEVLPIENPFAPHAPAMPAAFVNREREAELIFSHIRSAQRGNVAINGPLGMGKTSLLRYVADPTVGERFGVSAPTFQLIAVDIQSVTPFSADRFWRRVAQRLARLGSQGLLPAAQRVVDHGAEDVVDIEELLDAVADEGMVLVLLLDEFEWALSADTADVEATSRDFLAQMASLARRSPRVLSLVVATTEPLPDVTRVIESWRGSPFATVFTSVTLKPLSPADTNQLLDRALADGSVHFSADDRARLYDLSGGQPAALQAGAFALFHGRQQGLSSDAVWASAREAAAQLQAASSVTPATSSVTRPLQLPRFGDMPAANSSERPLTGLFIDELNGEVWVSDRRVESLTALEYNLLRLLYANPGRLCSKDDIVQQVWGDEFMGEIDGSRVEKLVSRLRRKVEPVPGRPQYIRTVRGRGYRFVP